MTALVPEHMLDTDALSQDIAAVLAAHGITGADVNVRQIEQGGMYAGVTISATAYERPAILPVPRDDDADLDVLFRSIAARIETETTPTLTVVK